MKRNEEKVNNMFALISVSLYQCEVMKKELEKVEANLKEVSEELKLLYHRVARESKPMRKKRRGKSKSKHVNARGELIVDAKPKRGRPAKKRRGRPAKV